jgi:hypothetical protein
MVSTLPRRPASGTAVFCCAVVTATVLICGCTRAVVGTLHAAPVAAGPSAPIPVADLLIEPGRFPAQYPAVVLDPGSVDRVLHEIDGVAAGSVVTPPECAPPPAAPQNTAAVQGVDDQNASSLIVAVTRPTAPLRARFDQLTACPSLAAVAGEVTATVTVTVVPPPPVDADDSYAVDQVVTSEISGSIQRALNLVAQIGDVRVAAAWMTARDDATPDTHTLHTLFTDAVLKVRRDGRP